MGQPNKLGNIGLSIIRRLGGSLHSMHFKCLGLSQGARNLVIKGGLMTLRKALITIDKSHLREHVY